MRFPKADERWSPFPDDGTTPPTATQQAVYARCAELGVSIDALRAARDKGVRSPAIGLYRLAQYAIQKQARR